MTTTSVNFYPAHGLDSYTGYGRMELGIAKGLQDSDVNVLLYPDLTHPMLMVNSSLQLLNAPHVNNTRLWAFNMIETDKVDPEWVAAINKRCERVLVPCPPMIEIYEKSGVDVPIDVVSLGVDLFDERRVHTVNGLTGDEDTFTFLTYSYGERRKGADIAVRAFQNAFGGDSRFRLVIKAREGFQESWLAALRDPQIELVTGRLTEEDWIRLQQQSHCFVFPSRGEGWGMPPRELTISGVPSIATQWLGMWDVDQWGIPLKYDGFSTCEFTDYQANAKDANWSEPDENHLVEQMKWVVTNYDAALRKTEAGREYLFENFSWKRIGERLQGLLREYA